VLLPSRLRASLKYALSPLLFRYPPFGLQPERLMVWLQTLERTANVPGAVVEIGCSVGGTAAVSHAFMRNLGIDKRYVALDTFGGFVDDQFTMDAGSGTPAKHRRIFSANSQRLTRRNLNRFGANAVQLVHADVVTVPLSELPAPVSACLIDVDLSGPVAAALAKLVPLMSPGGMVLVDDCGQGTTWNAREGYTEYIQAAGLKEEYLHGFGVVDIPDTGAAAAS